MKKTIFHTGILITCLLTSVFGHAAENVENINLYVAKLISKHDDEMIFIIANGTMKEFTTTAFNTNNSTLMTYFPNAINNPSTTSICTDPPIFIKLPPQSQIICAYSFASKLHKLNRWKEPFSTIIWSCREFGTGVLLMSAFSAWKPNEKNPVPDFRSQYDTKDALNFKIAKLLDGKCLSFAFIVSNNTSTAATLPGFYSSGNRLKIKFPDGKTFAYQPSATAKDLTLSSGKSEFVKFDLEDLLSQTKEFSMDNFNYGISELIWEIELPDKTVITKQFKLLKTKNPLPPEAKTGKGYVMDINTPLQ